jgi:hypothetical protein
MEAACYTLDLYCDDPKHGERHPNQFESLDAQYTGETYGECKKQAKADGWKWVKGSGIHDWNICGRCNKLNKVIVK